MLIPITQSPQVDFCWDPQYIQQNSCYSDVYNNKTSQQARRAGFREGVKMALDRGVKPNKRRIFKRPLENLHRLWIWLMVGAPRPRTETGQYWVPREGLNMTMLSDWDYVNVRDFDYLEQLWAGRDSMPEDVLHLRKFGILRSIL